MTTITIHRALLEQWKQTVNTLAALSLKSERYEVGVKLKQSMADELAMPKRCDLCGYQHGHQIGCANNPVDIALSKQALRAEPAKPVEPSYTATQLAKTVQNETCGHCGRRVIDAPWPVRKTAVAPASALRAALAAPASKPLFAELIAQHEGLAEELAAMDAPPAWHDAPHAAGLMSLIEDYATAAYEEDGALCATLKRTIEASIEQFTRAELEKPAESSYTATQLAAMVLSDCGISTDHTALHERVAARITRHEDDLIDRLKKLEKQDPPTPAWHDAPTEPGLWACVNSDGHRLFQEIASSGLKWVAQDGDRWYGPIPQDVMAEGGAA